MLSCYFPLRERRVQKSLFSGLISLLMECHTTTFLSLQEMVSECYCLTDSNQARYQKFCSKTKIPAPRQLPSTKDEFFYIANEQTT